MHQYSSLLDIGLSKRCKLLFLQEPDVYLVAQEAFIFSKVFWLVTTVLVVPLGTCRQVKVGDKNIGAKENHESLMNVGSSC